MHGNDRSHSMSEGHRRAVGARSEWSPGVLVGAFSSAAVPDCPGLTERELIAITERDVSDRKRFVDRRTSRGPGALRTGCVDRHLKTPFACPQLRAQLQARRAGRRMT